MAVDLYAAYGINSNGGAAQDAATQGATAQGADLYKQYGINPAQAQQTQQPPPAQPQSGLLSTLNNWGNSAPVQNINAFGAGVTKPAMNLGEGVAQLAGGPAAQTAQQWHNNLEQAYPSGTVADSLGQIAGYGALGTAVPGMAGGGALARLGVGAASNAAIGGLSYTDANQNRETNAATAGLMGAAGQVAGEVGNGIINYATRTPAQVLGADTKAMLAKSQDLVNGISPLIHDFDVGQATHNALTNYADQLEQNFQNLYQKAGEVGGQDIKLASPDVAKAYLQLKDERGDLIPPNVTKQLEQYSLFKPLPPLQTMKPVNLQAPPMTDNEIAAVATKAGQAGIDSIGKPLTISAANDLTQFINRRYALTSPTDTGQRGTLSALNKVIYSAMDNVNNGSEAAQILQQARQARTAYSNQFDQNDLVHGIVTNLNKDVPGVAPNYQIPPEQIVSKLVQGAKPIQNLQILKNAFTNAGTPEAAQAWQGIQRAAIQNQLLDPATKSGQFNPKVFLNHYNKMEPKFLETVADGNPEISGNVKLLAQASKYNLASAGTLATKVANLVKQHWLPGIMTLGEGGTLYELYKSAHNQTQGGSDDTNGDTSQQ